MTMFLASPSFPDGTALYENLLGQFYDIPEQSDDNLRKILSGASHKNVVKASSLQKMLSGVLEPKDLRVVFESLRSRTSVAKPDNVEKKFESFVQLVDSVVGHFLPWLLRGLQTLAPFGSAAAAQVRWSDMARDIEARLAGTADATDDSDNEPF